MRSENISLAKKNFPAKRSRLNLELKILSDWLKQLLPGIVAASSEWKEIFANLQALDLKFERQLHA